MAISIREALQLPVMKHTKLIAGEKGMMNTIKWVTIVEVLEDINRLQAGEFLITTGFGFKENPDKQEKFIELLASGTLSGVAIYTSFYMKKIPESFIDAANKNNLPLIEIPTDINFSVITKAILEQIVNNQIMILENTLNIHKKLTKLVLNNKDLNEITRTLSELTSAAALVFNDFHEITHQEYAGSASLIADGTSLVPENIEFSLRPDLLASKAREATILKSIADFKVIVSPIIAKNFCYGWITVFKPAIYWKEIDVIATEHAATIYAIEFLKLEAVKQTQMRLEEDFLDEIINHNDANKEAVIEKGKKIGYDLTLNQAIFYVTFYNANDSGEQLTRKLHHIVDQLLKKECEQYIIRMRADSLLMLTNVTTKKSQEPTKYFYQLAASIEKQWRHFFPNQPILIGIGKPYQDVELLSHSARQAQYAAKLVYLIGKNKRIIHYNELGMYHLLIEMKDSGMDLAALYKNSIGDLIRKNGKGVDLIKTLDAYLLNNESIQLAAEQLFVHRHTLKYRLNQIEAKTGLHLDSSDDRLRLQLGLMAYKLMDLLGKGSSIG